MPCSLSGKLDRKRLLEYVDHSSSEIPSVTSSLSKRLVEILRDLEMDEIDEALSFSDAGLSSGDLLRLANRVRSTYKVRLNYEWFFLKTSTLTLLDQLLRDLNPPI